jgi:predicted O-methyltransferase YrrM
MMRKEKIASYAYIESIYPDECEVQQNARRQSEKIGLSAISISKTEALMMKWICRLVQPSKIVEIGTLTGLSSAYFLELLAPDGHLWTLEKSEQHFQLASEVLKDAINSKKCEILLGDALAELPKISDQGPFDIIFIDGNKAAYHDYWKWAKNNLSKKGLILIDNVFLAGAVWGDQTLQRFNDKQVQNVKMMIAEIIEDRDFISTIIPTQEGLLLAQFR